MHSYILNLLMLLASFVEFVYNQNYVFTYKSYFVGKIYLVLLVLKAILFTLILIYREFNYERKAWF